MMLRYLLLFLLATSLNAKGKEWYQKINPSIEAGMHFSVFNGNVKNANSTSHVESDLDYKDSKSSYFAFGIRSEHAYTPNIKIDYFNHTQNKDSDHNKTLYIADGVFDSNTSISSNINYAVMNFTIFHDFQYKGRDVKFLRWSFYPGDIEYYIGVNIKYINWRFDVEKSTNATSQHWIEVKEIIPLPFIGFKYFYKNFRAYANISALSFNIAKSTNYEMGFSFQVFQDLYLRASYLYEDFQATENANNHTDTIKFLTSGNKFSFKYIF